MTKPIDTSEINPLTSKVYKQSIITSDTKMVRWLYIEGSGKIDEFSINSNKSNLRLRIVIDDNEVYNELISWFATNDALLNNSDSSGSFLLSIRDIYFKDSFTIEYTPAEATTISVIMVRYSVRGDKIKK